MNSFLERHKCVLEVMTPIHIGSGRKLGKKEYVYDRANARILIMDIPKLYGLFIARKKGEDFERFFMAGKEEKSNLKTFLTKAGLSESRFQDYAKYQLPASASELFENRYGRESFALSDLQTFVRDPYGLPYVPGTSIKGMLRTALLSFEMMRNSSRFRNLISEIEADANTNIRQRRDKFLRKEMTSIEKIAFKPATASACAVLSGHEPEKDMHTQMSWISVSDSKPLRNADLALCKKHDARTDGKRNSINIFRECLRPGTRIEFDLTIDKEHCAYTIEDIKDALSNLNALIVKRFINRFDKSAQPETSPVAWLGTAGFDSKTIIQALYSGGLPVNAKGGDEAARLTQAILKVTVGFKFKEHQHDLDISQFNASPHMRKETIYDGKNMDFGKAWFIVLD